MADFAAIIMEANDHSTGAPNWVTVGPTANHEVRWSDQADQHGVASAAWPAMIRPAATAIVNYTYAYTADGAGNGLYSQSGGVNTPVYAEGNYLWARWSWDNVGTFASAPIFTAYPTNAHGAVVRGDNSLLGGNNPDTMPVATEYSYLKGNAFGQVDSVAAPAAGPLAAPVVTSGTVGSVSPVAGANWIANFQDLQGDNDWILAPFTPAATTADTWSLHFALFTGPNMTPALYVVVMSLRYTWT